MAVVKASEADSSIGSLHSMTGAESTLSSPSKSENNVPDTTLLKELDKAVVDDADFLAWLNMHQDADPLSYYTEHSRRDSRDSLIGMAPALGERRSRAASLSIKSTPEGEEGPPSPAGRILHVLHLDRRARKREARLRAQLTKQALEELDMERWEARIRAEYEAEAQRQRERSASQTSARSGSHSSSDGQDDDSASDDASDTATPVPPNTTVHPEVGAICERVDRLVHEFTALREKASSASDARESLNGKGPEEGRESVTFAVRDQGETVKVLA